MIQAVIFDLDGTLLDRDRSLLKFVEEQFERLIRPNVEVDKESYIKRFIALDSRGYVWKDKVYQELIREFELRLDWNELLDDYKIGFSNHAVSFPNMIELLDSLKEKGYKLAMITNGFGDFQASNIQALQIAHYFDEILISEREGLRKPDPAIFLRAAEKLNVATEACVYVGDHPVNDITASKAKGMKGIWKEDNYYTESFEFDAKVKDLIEIRHLVEQWK
ncbi:HAD family hydrolase [Paenibacillus sp. FSL A5-0031]|uniref:HAD family hydrolase n=1 Tax=Paenibacillus sp. FSL A5-0031 TaxID=1920420 RepID=UPI00096CDF42|nr:HAD family hydrolase [Paenibacillus sp. FSL A5-0031]OME86233.1 HAD family hydrolase [Paenibacillus sp. FSL A5-0031]